MFTVSSVGTCFVLVVKLIERYNDFYATALCREAAVRELPAKMVLLTTPTNDMGLYQTAIGRGLTHRSAATTQQLKDPGETL